MRPLTEEEVTTYLEVFDLREKLIARLAIFEGLRPGEILALRWKALDGEILRVERARLQARLEHAEEREDPRRGNFGRHARTC